MANKENPILLPLSKGKFLNVVDLVNRKNDLFFGMNETRFNTDKFICFMDSFVVQIFKKTFVILDNPPNHKSRKFMAKREEWIEKDVFIYS